VLDECEAPYSRSRRDCGAVADRHLPFLGRSGDAVAIEEIMQSVRPDAALVPSNIEFPAH